MKNIKIFIATAALALLTGACAHDEVIGTTAEGSLTLTASVNTDMKVISRAVEDELIQKCMVWISNDKGLIRRYDSYDEIPTSPINLLTGHYVAEAWTGDSVPASWDQRWFKGREEFDINKGATTNVELVCKIANVGASVKYADEIDQILTEYSITVGHQGGKLVFEGKEERRGYFMMPSFDKNLSYELNATQIDGSKINFVGTVENATPGYEYRINVLYTPSESEVGGGIITIEVDGQEMEVNSDIQLVAAPKIVGYGFDIANPIMAEEGLVGRRTVYFSSATKITHILLTSSLFRNIDVIEGDDFELLGMSQEALDAINGAGINYKYHTDKDNDTETLIQLNFEEVFTNTLGNGEYTIGIEATDDNGKTSHATMTIIVSDAPVITAGTSNVSYFSATLTGNASKAGVENIGFNYRVKGQNEWLTVEADYTAGLQFAAVLEGLKDNTTYEYTATSGTYASPVVYEFTTLSAQLPNSGFEDWGTTGNVVIPAKDYASTFWDTGNHGSSTMGKMVTDKSVTYKHSGTYSAYLKSQFVGTFGIGRFAAGNIFAGKYLGTEGMDGVLGWGRPFTLTPKSVKVWIKYNPGVADNNGSGSYLSRGSTDQGIIYMALLDGSNDPKNVYKDEQWPFVVKTKSSAQQLFSKDEANVIAYGEYIIEKATDGSGMVQIEFPLNYYRPGETPAYVIFVASASRYGDYFQGGEGSELYIDDIELIY